MAFRKLKSIFFVLLFALVFSHCGEFKEVFNGKPNSSHVSQKKKSRKYRSKRPVPAFAKNYFSWPLQAPLSSLYGPRSGNFHDGIDIDGDLGDEVLASAPGEVVFSDRLGGYGQLVVIKHPNGFFTAYAHNKKNLVKKGSKIKKGQKIALVGSTGRSTGDHLHFEIRDEGGTYDPLDFLPSSRYVSR